MKVKSTKSALLMSFTSLLLCFAMLIGSTFAWFTDSVTSGVNQIKAGNLDIEVSYKNASGEWVSIEGKDTLFGKNALWEPGHTEFVTLKIENKGNLALKYQMKVSPVSESGGINVFNEQFKLSDYLKFGTTAPVDSDPSYADRAAARAAVTTAVGLAQAGLGQTGEMTTQGETKYITLVVYMPEDVDNHANYKTGTAAPFINLGITVLATQLNSESDSFNNEYDAATSNDTSVVYNYFPQVVATATLTKGEGGAITSTDENVVVAADNSKVTLKSAEKLSDATTPVAQVEIPAGAINTNDKFTFEAKKVETATANTISVGVGQEAATYDVSLSKNGEKITTSQNGIIYKSTFHIGEGKTNATFYHGTTPMNKNTGEPAADTYSYDESTGMLTIWVSHYSEFTAVYDEPVAAIGTTAYYSLATAVAAAKSNDTVTLLKSVEGSGVMLKAADAKNITINLDGKTYTFADPAVGSAGTETQGFHFEKGNTVTVKNGTLNAKLGNKNVKMLIQNYCDLTLDGVTVDGTNLNGAGNGRYVVSNNNGTVTIKNTTINAASDGVAFDVYSFGSYTGANVTVQNSVINGRVEVGVGKKDKTNQEDADTTNLGLSIESGTINGDIVVDDIAARKTGVVSITGGTFSEKLDASFIAEGKEAIDNGNGTWTVGDIRPEAKIGDTEYATLAEAVSGAQSGNTIEITKAKTYAVPSPVNMNVTIKGAVPGVIFDATGTYGTSAGSFPQGSSFENVTFNFGSALYHGFQHSGNMVFKDCTIKGGFNCYGANNFTNCTFDLTQNAEYVWTYGADVTFTGCTFNTLGKAILCYNEGAGLNGASGVNNVSVTNCTFNATAGAQAGTISNQNCAAIEIDNFGKGVNLTLSGNTVDTANDHFSGEWRIKRYVAPETDSVTVNGKEYKQIALDGKLMTINNKEVEFVE